MNLLHGLKDIARGLLMGAADIVPGVSGGTMALIVGIYDRLVAAISRATSAAIALLRLDRKGVARHLGLVDWGLLLPLGAGILTAIVIGARFIPGIMESYPIQSRGLFFGLIAGSLIIPWSRIRHHVRRHIFVAVGAAVVAFSLVGLPPREISSPTTLYIFLTAAIATCAMILPGVSGAFLLLVFGVYEPTLRAVDQRDLLYIATLGVGAAVGVGSFSKLLTWLLHRHFDYTMAVLMGLMAGSLRALWPYLAEDRSLLLPTDGEPIGSVILLALLGAGFVTLLHLGALWRGQRSATT